MWIFLLFDDNFLCLNVINKVALKSSRIHFFIPGGRLEKQTSWNSVSACFLKCCPTVFNILWMFLGNVLTAKHILSSFPWFNLPKGVCVSWFAMKVESSSGNGNFTLAR